MSYDPEKVIRIATRLKAAKEQVSALEEQLRSIVMDQDQRADNSPIRRRRSRSVSEVATKVIDLLKQQPDKAFSVEDVQNQLEMKGANVRPLLSRLSSRTLIEKRGRGMYGAVRGESLDMPATA